jgi:uncharacterized pyridoxamine 5'-phosphate oxidase family protein
MLFEHLFEISMRISSLVVTHCVAKFNIYATSDADCISVFYIHEEEVNLVLQNICRSSPRIILT